MTLRSCWATSGGRRYRWHNSGNKNRQYPVRVGLSLRQTVPGAESSHDRKGWEICGTGWGNVRRKAPVREAYRSVRLITKNEPVVGRNIFRRA